MGGGVYKRYVGQRESERFASVHQIRLATSAFLSTIDTVPIDNAIALANDDAAGSSVTSPPNLQARAAQRHAGLVAGTDHCWEGGRGRGAYACWLFAYAHTQ